MLLLLLLLLLPPSAFPLSPAGRRGSGVGLERELSSAAASWVLMGRLRTGYEHTVPRRLHRVHEGVSPEHRTFWRRHALHALKPRRRRGFPGHSSSSSGHGTAAWRGACSERSRPRRPQLPQVLFCLSHRT